MKKTMWMAVAALALPAAANAAPTHCAPSNPAGLFACASFQVSYDETTGVITVKVQNNDVWAVDNGVNPADTWYGITGFGIQAPEILDPSLAGVGTEGAATPFGTDPAGSWTFETNLSGFFVEAGASSNGINGAVYGCNGTAGNRGYTTCDGDDNAGFVVFTFNTGMAGTAWDAGSAQIAYRAQGSGVSFRCADLEVPNGAPCPPPTSTVPEPMSLVLLATGLLGVGGVTLRRRRNGLDV